MRPSNFKSDSYAEYNVDNEKDPKFKVGDHVRTSKYKNVPNRSEEFFVISKIKNKVRSMDVCY